MSRIVRATPWPVKVLLLLVLLAGSFIGLLNIPPVTRELGRRVAEVASAKTGMVVQCQAAHILPTGVQLSELSISRNGQRAISFRSLTLYPRLRALLSGHVFLRHAEGSGFQIVLPPADQAPAEPSPDIPPDEKNAGTSRREKIARLLDPDGFQLRLFDGEILWGDDQAPRARLPITDVGAHWPHPGRFPIDATVNIAPIQGEGGLTIEAESLGEAAGAKVHVRGLGVPLEAYRASLDALLPARLYYKVMPLLVHFPHLPAVGGDFTLEYDGRAHTVSMQGKVVASGTVVQDEKLAQDEKGDPQPVGPIDFSQDVSIAVYLDGPDIKIDRWEGQVNKAHYRVQGQAISLPEGIGLQVTLELDHTPYQDLIDSIPASAAPALAGVKMSGSLSVKATLSGNTSDLSTLVADAEPDWGDPKLESPSSPLQGEKPLQGFVYVPYSRDGVHREFILGRGQSWWIPMDQIPKHLVHSLLLSEDITFFQHKGFDPEGLKKAWKDNLKAGRAVRGGSTITQQLAKNLFLRRDKTALRKLQEAVLTFELEQVLKKNQILEFYFNIIEWGPGIYGIGRASQHYFGKEPAELSVREGAYLCSIIPNPIRYYMYFQRGELTERWNEHVQAVVDRLRAFEYLDEEQYQQATDEVLSFRGSPRAAVDVHQMEAEDAAEQKAEDEGEGGGGPVAPPVVLPEGTAGQ